MKRNLFSRSDAGASVRPSPIAGQWYPGTPDRLRESIRRLLDEVTETRLNGRLIGLVAPHAGHRYSGAVAAHAYRLVQGAQYDVVAILAPNHRVVNQAPYLTSNHSAYWTPLGEVPLARELVAELNAQIGLTFVNQDEEHSLEIQLPFLQVALAKEFQLLPVMVNDQSRQACLTLGETLADLLQGQNVLLVASTDLSHFHDAQTAAWLDGAVTDQISAFDPEGLLDVLEMGKGHACGGGPTAAVMKAASVLGANHAKLLEYATSGDVTGDFHSVVGYAAAALYVGSD